jgi:adenylyl-sulfate kinase
MPFTNHDGAVLWLTGLPASGKTTLAQNLHRLLEDVGAASIILDGDELRKARTVPLGYTKEDRDEAVHLAGLEAMQKALDGAIVIVAMVSPFRDARRAVRLRVKDAGFHFIEVFLDTPIEICIDRDPKGLYGKALTGELSNMTGINDPYETPEKPEVIIGWEHSPHAAAQYLIDWVNPLVRESTNQRINESTNQRINELAERFGP